MPLGMGRIMTNFRVVPDVLREREPSVRGRIPKNPLSKALLNGQTVFITGPKQTWGSLYTLAKNHKKQAKTKRTVINSEEGTLCWFEDIVTVDPRLAEAAPLDVRTFLYDKTERHVPSGSKGDCACGLHKCKTMERNLMSQSIINT